MSFVSEIQIGWVGRSTNTFWCLLGDLRTMNLLLKVLKFNQPLFQHCWEIVWKTQYTSCLAWVNMTGNLTFVEAATKIQRILRRFPRSIKDRFWIKYPTVIRNLFCRAAQNKNNFFRFCSFLPFHLPNKICVLGFLKYLDISFACCCQLGGMFNHSKVHRKNSFLKRLFELNVSMFKNAPTKFKPFEQSCKNVPTVPTSRCYFFPDGANLWAKHANNCANWANCTVNCTVIPLAMCF